MSVGSKPGERVYWKYLGARATNEVAERLEASGCSITLRWAPAHKGAEDNEVAGEYAKEVAECAGDVTDRGYLRPFD